MALAMSFPVAFSIPSSPGDEFTSNNKGPLDERIISTPATFKFIALAAFIAIFFSFLFNSDVAAELKQIILLETMDVKVVRDRSHWFQIQMKELGYIEGVTTINSQVVLVIVLGNKIINCFPSAVEVIKD